jgi:hypothetical protein
MRLLDRNYEAPDFSRRALPVIQLRYRIITTGMKGVTPQDPFKRQKQTPKNPIFLYRFIGIGGTGRNISATGREVG